MRHHPIGGSHAGCRSLLLLLLLVAAILDVVCANVEKAVFLGPATVNIPAQGPSLSALSLDTLTPENTSIRLELARRFPSASESTPVAELVGGETSWFVLDNLTEGQRYEVRICWSALEPTAFDLQVFGLKTVWETPELIQSLAAYSYSRLDGSSPESGEPPIVHDRSLDASGERQSSLLFLRVVAAADYFTDDVDLMSNPPPVLVDLILDPFLLNVLPQSLLATVGYVVVVAVASLFIARWIATSLQSLAEPKDSGDKKSR